MKTTLSVLLLCCAVALPAIAQLVPTDPTAPAVPVSSAAAIAAIPPTPDGYSVTEIGPNHRRWTRATALPDASGNLVYTTNSYVELQDCLYYVSQGPAGPEWAESKAEIVAFPGGAIASNGPIQMIFPNDLSAEPIDAQTAAGRFRSAVSCLSYADYGLQTNLIIAQIQPCQGQIIAPNQVLYPKALSDNVSGSVRYTYRKSGWEQDILIDDPTSLPTPESMGLDSGSPTLMLQVTTEFLQAPTPQTSQRTMTAAGLTVEDQEVDWGALRLGQGQAFFFGQSGSGNPVTTAKRWVVTPDNRQFLVEEVPFSQLLRGILSRPGGASLENPGKRFRALASLDRLPKLKPAEPNSRRMELAATRRPERGLIIDYLTMAATATNYVFQGDTTYYISGAVTLLGTNTWEGGTVLKFATNASVSVTRQYNISPQIAFLTKPFLPVICTAKDDNSTGESISGSTGNPSGYYANPALSLSMFNPAGPAAHLRIAYAQLGIIVGDTSSFDFSDAQFVNCQNGIYVSTASVLLRNALFSNTLTNFIISTGTLNAQNASFCGSLCLARNSTVLTNASLTLTNCVLANVTNLPASNVQLSGGYNAFYNTPQFGANTLSASAFPFQSAGAGAFYLADGSGLRNAGTTNIDSNLLADLRATTTYPPILCSNLTLSVDTTLWPQAQRDTDLLDLGYHYRPIDYLWSCCISNATLNLTNGVVLAYFDSTGIWLHNGGHLVSGGSPVQRNYLVHCNLAQEQPIDLASHFNSMPLRVYHTDASRNPSVALRFTTLAAPLAAGYVVCTGGDGWETSVFALQDCEVYGAGASWIQSGAAGSLISLRNNLVRYANVDVETSGQVTTYNNLFTSASNYICGFVKLGTDPYTNTDNAFDRGSVYLDGCVSNNAYLNGVTLLSTLQPGDIVTNLAWLSGRLGDYYQPTNSPLINRGSRAANLAGLYHYTTQTNQVKETNSVVDISYHYVAVDGRGNPFDTDGDGVPDYLEDNNGNGLVDSGETDWQSAGDLGLKVLITRPKNNSIIP